MSNMKIWGWNKKVRTMLRFIKPGDIFCFQLNEQTYCFGRIIAETIPGHIAEIFDYMSAEPVINGQDIEASLRLMELLVLDSYGLFDRKIKGDWRIIGHQKEYVPSDVENVYFTYGIGASCKKIDVYGNKTSISQAEQSNYMDLSPRGDGYIKNLITAKIELEKNV